MSKELTQDTFYQVHNDFTELFEKVRDLYNIRLSKNKKYCSAVEAKKYANELFKQNCISECIKDEIEEAYYKLKTYLALSLIGSGPNKKQQLYFKNWALCIISHLNKEIGD